MNKINQMDLIIDGMNLNEYINHCIDKRITDIDKRITEKEDQIKDSYVDEYFSMGSLHFPHSDTSSQWLQASPITVLEGPHKGHAGFANYGTDLIYRYASYRGVHYMACPDCNKALKVGYDCECCKWYREEGLTPSIKSRCKACNKDAIKHIK